MREFKDKVAVVTGAASGIGRALAERAAREGMKVVLADIEEEPLAQAEGEITAAGGTALAVRTDVSKADDVEALARQTVDAFGAVHLVCNNAGVGLVMKASWEATLEDWHWCLGVNLWGVIHGIHTFVPIMLEQDTEGHVVNTASVAGLISLPYVAPYHATKHAVVTITESLHYELALRDTKIKASVLCPGFIQTRIMDADRNRPAELGTESADEATTVPSMLGAYRQAVDVGFPAAYVAEQVFHAIWQERLYIRTGYMSNDWIRRRADGIVLQRNPVLSPEIMAVMGIGS
jgi:NAD(P)-dependent dehydrogenase (short-subunit alcohol dehydrogenase family)